MANKIAQEGLTYDDVLLIPTYTDFKRREVDLKVELNPKIKLSLPVLSSPMDTVTEGEMALAMAKNGGLGVIHRNINIDEQVRIVKDIKAQNLKSDNTDNEESIITSLDQKGRVLVAAAVGAGSDMEERVNGLAQAEVDMIVVDSGHGHAKYILDAVKQIKKLYPEMVVMAGNVATYDGAKALVDVGVDVIRVGVGPGSICTTRIISGMGVPQLTAVEESVRAVEGTSVTVIADGGIKQTGDMAKALGFGAHAVMLGSLLAGYKQSPGEIVELEGKKYKQYRGMGSLGAMVKGGAERYGQNPDELKTKLIPEGVEALKQYKGDVDAYLYQVAGSLRSSLYYIGSKNLKEFRDKAKFVKITPAGMKESHPHSVVITDGGSNYNLK